MGGGYRCVDVVNDAWLADTLAFDGLHGLVHVDMELVAGSAAIERWLVDGVGGTWSGCVSGVVTRRLGDVGGRLPWRVVFVGIFDFAWVGFALLFPVVGGSAHASDFGLEGHVLVLPFHHGLLSIQRCIVEGIIREGFVVCEGRNELYGVWRWGTSRRLSRRRGDAVVSSGESRGNKTSL